MKTALFVCFIILISVFLIVVLNTNSREKYGIPHFGGVPSAANFNNYGAYPPLGPDYDNPLVWLK